METLITQAVVAFSDSDYSNIHNRRFHPIFASVTLFRLSQLSFFVSLSS